MPAKLTSLTHKIAVQLRLVIESCTGCSSRSKRPVQKLFDKPSYTNTDIRAYAAYLVQNIHSCD